MITKEDLEVGFNMMVCSVLGAGQKKITQYMKDKGISDETLQKAKDAADSLVKDLFEKAEE